MLSHFSFSRISPPCLPHNWGKRGVERGLERSVARKNLEKGEGPCGAAPLARGWRCFACWGQARSRTGGLQPLAQKEIDRAWEPRSVREGGREER